MFDIEPLVIAIWCGDSKPNELNAFLRPFVTELEELLQNGLSINGHHITIKVRCFICDTPARALIKGIVSHNHRYGCQKCMIVGKYFRRVWRMSYYRIPVTNEERAVQLRTNIGFRERQQPEHHREDSLLESLPIDMVKAFPVSDSLHLLDLGVMKR